MLTIESLPNEIILIIFSYLKTYEIVYGFYFLQRRYARLIEDYRSFSTSINLLHAPVSVFNFYCSLLLQSKQIHRLNIKTLKLECNMLDKLLIDEHTFPQLKSLSIIVRKPNELTILLKYFSYFPSMKELFIRSDVCCCDRILFEEYVKQYIFQTNQTSIQSLIFATPPCYSISLQDVQFQKCLFTNLTLTVRSINDVCLILNNAENLRALRIRVLDTNINPHNPLSSITTCSRQLTSLLFICSHPICFDIVKNIFQKLINLKKLTFSLVFDIQSGIIDGNRLYQEIFISLPQLITIQFEMKSLISMISSDIINSFQNSFWSRFSPVGFHSYNHIYTLPFPFHHLDLDQSILKRQQTRQANHIWRLVRDIELYDRIPYTNEFLSYLQQEFTRLTSLTLKSKFDLMSSTPSISTWFCLPTLRRLTIKSTYLQNPKIIQEFLRCLPNCDTLDCDYVLIARTTCYFRPKHRLNPFGKRLRLLLVDELPSDWKNERKKRKNIYFHRFRKFFPNIECPLYN